MIHPQQSPVPMLLTKLLIVVLMLLMARSVEVEAQTSQPSHRPSQQPSESPSLSANPSSVPSRDPSSRPSRDPSSRPSRDPSSRPSRDPSSRPSLDPSSRPSRDPSSRPSRDPSSRPSRDPSSRPSRDPSSRPSRDPSSRPSLDPSSRPSRDPSSRPSRDPSSRPSRDPSSRPSRDPSSRPSRDPSSRPSRDPSSRPSAVPSRDPSSRPSRDPSSRPSAVPSRDPSSRPSRDPSSMPSNVPSRDPSSSPSSIPSSTPSQTPSALPSSTPSANPSQGCENTRTDCGYGIFNPWTCRCDCPAGICLDANEQCYTTCEETINTNPWAGCSPGWDCPWFPDKESGYCKSEVNQPNKYEIYRLAQECCDKQFPGSSTCLQDSNDSHAPFPWPVLHRPNAPPVAKNIWGTEASHTTQWFPDLINKQNCVRGNNYENWMQTDGFQGLYLFGNNSTNCCKKWFPYRTDCPDNERAVNPENEDEPWHNRPGSSTSNYFFPDFSKSSCAYGRDYPTWMGDISFEKHYLFRQGSECCTKYFPTASNCPYEDATQAQSGYYWTSYQDSDANSAPTPIKYNHTFYPDISANACVNGTDYPAWMASDDNFKRTYLVSTIDGCCTKWFPSQNLNDCKNNVIQGVYDILPCPTNRPDCNATVTITNMTAHLLGMWYPDLGGSYCKKDGLMPEWMLASGFAEEYLFNTREQCCSKFGLCN